MTILRIAAFADGEIGGNPAGVSIADVLPSAVDMQRIAAEVGFSETAFATPCSEGWRVRYFSPESEVPFCGHATIALGAALADRDGNGVFTLVLNDATITVEGQVEEQTQGLARGRRMAAALQSPGTRSEPAEPALVSRTLELFGYQDEQLDAALPAALAFAGANHLVIGLNSREALAAMHYDLDAGRTLMNEASLVTIAFVFAETPGYFHVRNAFASGGVLEDPATGAAAAALGGYLRDLGWPHEGEIDIVQGEDMGARSLLHATIPPEAGASIRVSGTARFMDEGNSSTSFEPDLPA